MTLGIWILILCALVWWERRRQRWYARNYTQQVQAWGASDPVIPPLDLPTVKPLTAQKVLNRFQTPRLKRRA